MHRPAFGGAVHSQSSILSREMDTMLSQATVLVTGGCGFIGSHLIEKLLKSGVHRVIALDSMEYGRPENLAHVSDSRLEIVQHRLAPGSREYLKAVLRGVDYVFHLAAEKHNQSLHDPQRVIDANITGTYELLHSAHVAGVRKVVFSSSLYAYGRMAGGPFREDEVPAPETIYGISKLNGEHLCWHFWRKHGLRSAVLRYLFVYGPRQYANLGYKSVIVKNFQRILAGEPPVVNGDGNQVLDYVYVDDVVNATIQALLLKSDYEVFNIGSGQGISVNDLTRRMLTVADKELVPVPGPADVTHGSSRVGDISKARALLGLQLEIPLDTGLARVRDWILSNRGLAQ